MNFYERTQVIYFCEEVINVRIEVVYNVPSMRYVNKCHIFVKEVLLTQTAPHRGGSEIKLLKIFPKIAMCPNDFGQDCLRTLGAMLRRTFDNLIAHVE